MRTIYKNHTIVYTKEDWAIFCPIGKFLTYINESFESAQNWIDSKLNKS